MSQISKGEKPMKKKNFFYLMILFMLFSFLFSQEKGVEVVGKEILKNRMKIKKQTIRERRKINKMIMLEFLSNGIN